jgi:hypothetical protein
MAKKQKKEVPNLSTLHDAEITELYKKLIKKPLLDHKRPELERQIRVYYAAKGIKELPNASLLPGKAKKMRKENFQFTRNFTEEEMKIKSKEISAACVTRTEIESELKAVKSSYKSKLDAEATKINLLANELQRGSETVLKTCDVFYDFDRGLKHFYYEGKEVGQERMTKADYQLQTEFPE